MSPPNIEDLVPKHTNAIKQRDVIRTAIDDLISSVLKENSTPSNGSLEILANAFSNIDLSIKDILNNTSSIKTASNIFEEQNNKKVRLIAHHLGYTLEVGEKKNSRINKTTQHLIAKECHELRKTVQITKANEIVAEKFNVSTRTVQKYYKAEKHMIMFIEEMLKDPYEVLKEEFHYVIEAILRDGNESAMEAVFNGEHQSSMEAIFNNDNKKQK